jgi:hypothetical protein
VGAFSALATFIGLRAVGVDSNALHLLAMLIVGIGAMAILGAVIARAFVLPLRSAPALNTLLITLMLGTVLRESVRLFYPDGANPKPFPRLLPTDSISFGNFNLRLDNAILLSDSAETVQQRVMKVYTDPTRLKATDPGHIEGNVAFVYHDLFNPNQAEVADLKERYVAGKVGDVEVKKKLAAALNAFLEPMRERRARYEAQPDLVDDVIATGNRRMAETARETMARVREAMGLTYFRG